MERDFDTDEQAVQSQAMLFCKRKDTPVPCIRWTQRFCETLPSLRL